MKFVKKERSNHKLINYIEGEDQRYEQVQSKKFYSIRDKKAGLLAKKS